MDKPVIPPLGELLATAHAKKVQIKRTATDNNPPATNSLLPGELAVEMGTPVRLWVGVPPALDSTGKKLIIDVGVDAGHVKKAGDTMTGPLVLPGDPTVDLHAADKHYVDAGDAATLAAANAHSDNVALSAVRYDANQALTGAQKLQARTNIYAAPGDAMALSGIQVNSSCEVSQRYPSPATAGTLVNGTPRYLVDGLRASYFHAAATAIIAGQQTLVGPPGFPAFAQLTCAGVALSAPAAGDHVRVSVPVEGYRCARMGWWGPGTSPLTACFFFYANVAGTLTLNVRNSGADRSYVKDLVYPAANAWSYYKVTIPPPPSGTWLVAAGIGLDFGLTFACGTTYQGANGVWSNGNFLGSAGTSNFFAASGNFIGVTGITLLPGNDGPADYLSLANVQRPFADELIRCQRYYEKSFDYGVLPAAGTGPNANAIFPQIGAASAAPVQGNFWFKVTKRTQSTVTLYNPSNPGALAFNVSRGTNWVSTAINAVGPDAFQVYGQTPSSSAMGDTCGLHWTADAGL
jgi:hypothetical protein